MTLNQLKNAIISELSSRSLKDPQIRKNALEKVCKYITEYQQIYLHDQNVVLPKDKNEYERYKNTKMNGAENSIINEIYNQLNKAAK